MNRRTLICKRLFSSAAASAAPLVKFNAKIPFGSSAKELATPLVFVSGEGLSTNIWSSSVSHFTARGYHGLSMELPYNAKEDHSVEELVEYMNNTLKSCGDLPPVMVAHSLSSFIAQKFLESYPLTGLIMVNPIPIDISATATLLIKEWNSVCFRHTSSSTSNETLIRAYYRSNKNGNVPTSPIVTEQKLEAKWRPGSLKLMNYLSTNPDANLNLEPGSVPMGLILSEIDCGHFVKSEGIEELAAVHDINTEQIYHFRDDNSRLTMFNNPDFNNAIAEWLERFT